MRTGRKWTLWASFGMRIVIVGVTVGMLSSCTGVPDRERQAQQLEDAVRGMPGVDNAVVTYSNNFTLGAEMDITVHVDGASINQIETAATRIADSYGQDVGEFRRSASFRVGGGEVDHHSGSADRPVGISPELVVADARAIRRIRSTMSNPAPERVQIRWQRTAFGSELTLRGAVDDTDLAAVRAAVGESPVLVRITPDSPAASAWTTEFPFRSQDEEEVRRTLSRLPLSATAVTVSAGHISELRIAAPGADDAYARLVSVIDVAAPTREHPMMLTWDEGRAPGTGDQRRFRVSVHVGGCSYPSSSGGELEPGKYYTDDSLAVQRRLRDEYDTCPT